MAWLAIRPVWSGAVKHNASGGYRAANQYQFDIWSRNVGCEAYLLANVKGTPPSVLM
jgi:hypothetical protein